MSMYCGHEDTRRIGDTIHNKVKCNKRLWPSESSGRTYKNETKPIVTRDASGTITAVRCEWHAIGREGLEHAAFLDGI